MKVKNNKDMFFGNVHFSDNIGLPFLVNCVLTLLIHSAYSDGLPRIAKEPATKVSRVNKEQFTTSNTNYSGKKVQYSHNNKFATAKPAFMQRTEFFVIIIIKIIITLSKLFNLIINQLINTILIGNMFM